MPDEVKIVAGHEEKVRVGLLQEQVLPVAQDGALEEPRVAVVRQRHLQTKVRASRENHTTLVVIKG